MSNFERTKELFSNRSAILVHCWPVSLVIRYRPFKCFCSEALPTLDGIPHHIKNKNTPFRDLINDIHDLSAYFLRDRWLSHPGL